MASNSAASQVHQLTQAIATVTSAGVAKVASNVTLSNAVTCGSTVVTTTVKARPGVAGGQQVAIQDTRTTSAVVASVANLQAAQRIATASLVSAGQSGSGAAAAAQKGLVGVTLATATGTKTLTAAHLQYYRQQQQQVMLRQHHLKVCK